MTWKQIPGEWSLVAVGENGRRYRVHLGHGRIWYALEFAARDVLLSNGIAGANFCGPEASRKAREWCEARAVLPRPKTGWDYEASASSPKGEKGRG